MGLSKKWKKIDGVSRLISYMYSIRLSGKHLMQNLKLNHKMEHDKQVRKKINVMSASAHYSRLFFMKIADFLYAFHQCLALKLKVVLLVKFRSKGKLQISH